LGRAKEEVVLREREDKKSHRRSRSIKKRRLEKKEEWHFKGGNPKTSCKGAYIGGKENAAKKEKLGKKKKRGK